VLDRYTARCRRVVILAQEEARARHHGWIGTEHLLLGLLAESESDDSGSAGIAARTLERLGIGAAALRRDIDAVVPDGDVPPGGFLPFTDRAKRALDLSQRAAREFDHEYVGVEHLLLGLVRETDGVAGRVLQRLGADPEATRAHIADLLAAR
jgi:ATP-dependent Clp protease ATP-binding subunit ClpC